MKINNTIKTVLVVALCLFGAGLLICLGTFFAGGMSFKEMSPQMDSSLLVESEDGESIEKTIKASSKDIELEMSFAEVQVALSDDDDIHLSYSNSPVASFVFDENSERICLRQQKQSIFGLTLTRTCVTLLVPKDYKGDLEIDTTSGRARLEGISLRGEAEISSTSGSIRANNISLKSLSIGATSGSIGVEGAKVTDSIELGSTSGSVSLSEVEAKEFELAATSGSVQLANVKAGKLRAATTSGSVKLSNVDSKAISLGATSGGISGTLAGSSDDYTVDSRTRSGRNDLADHRGTGSRSLDVTTTSGRISIEFAD